MMIIMQPGATKEQINEIVKIIEENNLSAHLITGVNQTVIGAVGDCHDVSPGIFESHPAVQAVQRITQPYKLASLQFHPQQSEVPLDGFAIGGREIPIIAGPCSVESRDQVIEIAHLVKNSGANALRGGVFKPRQSPYTFQGLGQEGLEYLAEAKEQTGLPIVVEVMAVSQIPLMMRYVDMLQIGARNMQNFDLLRAVGELDVPVLLKRGLCATIDDLLMSAEYILSSGNNCVVLCERGIRTFENATRNTTDINAFPVLKSRTHLPVILDPSHATGISEFVTPIAMAGIAAGADGVIVEVHPNPSQALTDGRQSLDPISFSEMVCKLNAIAGAVNRNLVQTKATMKIDEVMIGQKTLAT